MDCDRAVDHREPVVPELLTGRHRDEGASHSDHVFGAATQALGNDTQMPELPRACEGKVCSAWFEASEPREDDFVLYGKWV